MDPRSGRPVAAQLQTMKFDFDQSAQTMSVDNEKLTQVRITDSSAQGRTKSEIVLEVNRITGTATARGDDAESRKYNLNGSYFRGTCAVAGSRAF